MVRLIICKFLFRLGWVGSILSFPSWLLEFIDFGLLINFWLEAFKQPNSFKIIKAELNKGLKA